MQAVFVLTRHGARTPNNVNECIFGVKYLDSLLSHEKHTIVPVERLELSGKPTPNSSRDEADDKMNFLHGGNCLPGQLTAIGAERQYEIGQKLRERYIKEFEMLNADYVETEVTVRSSNVRRTVLSARSVLAGLYPNYSKASSIPIYINEPEEEVIQPKTAYVRSFFKDLLNENEKLQLEQVTRAVQEKLNVAKSIDIFNLWDNLETLKDLHLYPAIDSDVQKFIEDWGRKLDLLDAIGLQSKRAEVLRATSGPLLDYIQSNMEAIAKQQRTTPMLFLFSGHEMTLLRMINVLGLDVTEIPPTNSTLVIELLKPSPGGKHHVKVFYNDSPKCVRGCDSHVCTLDEFLSATASYRLSLEEYRKICGDFERK